MKNKKIIAAILSLGLLASPISAHASETEPNVAEETEHAQDFSEDWEGKSFEEVRDFEIERAKGFEGFIDEAKKDLIVKLMRTSSKEDVAKVLASFNPQGPVEEYPTLKTKHSLTQRDDGGYDIVVEGINYVLDSSGNFQGGFKSEESARSIQSQYNALVAKFVVKYDILTVEQQADYQIVIENMRGATESDSIEDYKDVILMHKQLNDDILKLSQDEGLVYSNEQLNKYLNDDFSKFNDDSNMKDTEENSDTETQDKASEDDTSKEPVETVKSVESGKDNKNKEAGPNVKTGVGSVSAIGATLIISGATFIIGKKKTE